MTVSGPSLSYSSNAARCQTPCGAITGGGGRHLFYLTPPGLVIPSLRGWMTGIDIRSDGGYVILPEGRHKSGAPYRWVNWGDIASTPLPPDIANMIMNRPRSTSGTNGSDLGDTATILQGVPERLSSWLHGNPGTRRAHVRARRC